jgi:hypothetical protein
MAISQPNVTAENYLDEDSVDAAPKHGTTVQAGWGAAAAILKPKRESGDYPTDFRFSEKPQLVRFLENEPFAIYEQHWIDRTEGKRSFVALGDNDPLTIIAGSKPRARFAFNVLVLTDEEPTVQIMTVPASFARQLQQANEDPRRGPLTKYYWAISRQGTGPSTQYMLDRVRASDLAEEWDLDPENVEAAAASAVPYDKSVIYVASYEDHLKLARELVG